MFYIIVILGAIFSMPAKADETLKFRVVQYVASVQSQQVGDVNNHVQGFIRHPGIASVPDGSTARTFVFNAFDGISGPGGGEQSTAMKTSFSAMVRSSGGSTSEHTKSTAKGYFQEGAPSL